MAQSTNKNHQPLGGYVTSPKDFTGKTRKIESDGIFSEQIFGPIQSYHCASNCGYYNSKILYQGQICPRCGVLCTTNDVRYDVFGKIRLVFPVIKFNKRDKFLKIIGSKYKNLLNPNRSDYLTSTTHYVGVKRDLSDIKIFNDLTQTDEYMVIPFRVTGTFSLYIVLRFIYTYLNVPIVKKIFDNEYITREIKVLPPNLRLVSYDSVKREIRTPEINKKYITVLKKNQLNKSIELSLPNDENDWVEKIRYQLANKIFDQDIVEPTVIEYDIESAKYQWFVDQIFKSVYNQLSGKTGLIRNNILAKNIEFSARTVVSVNPSLKPYEVKVSKKILKKLWLPYFLYYLKHIKQFSQAYCYNQLLLYEDTGNEFDHLFDDFLDWFYDEKGDDHVQ